MGRRWGTPQNFFLEFKSGLNLFIKKLLKWANKKRKKAPENIIILHLCTKHFGDISTVPEIQSVMD